MPRPFTPISPHSEVRGTYDAVVIGSGIGGLICANLLARDGLQVLLVEQHYMVGGYCSGFRRNGFIFDAASHFYPLLGNSKSISGRLLQDMGVATEWVKMDPVDQFHLPDGSHFEVPAEFGAYLRKLKLAFPTEGENIDSFFRLTQKLYLWGILRYFRGAETGRFNRLATLSVRDALNQFFRSDKLKLLLTADCPHWGSPPCRTSFVFDSMLRMSYFEGNYYPLGGTQAFADELARRFQSFGGHILTKSLVRRIEVRGQRVVAVEIESGALKNRCVSTISAGHVVSNADMRQTVFKMIGGNHFPSDFIVQLNRLRATFPCFLSHIGLRDVPTEVLRRVHGYHWSGWDSDRVGTDAFDCKLFVPTLYEPRLAPKNCHVLIVQKVMDVDYESIQDWSAHKRNIERFAFAKISRLIPRFADKVVVCESASAQTSYRFTLNYHGAMLGWEMSADQLGNARPSTNSPIRDLHFVGQWTRPGGGITPVIISAMNVANQILGARSAAGLDSETADEFLTRPETSDNYGQLDDRFEGIRRRSEVTT